MAVAAENISIVLFDGVCNLCNAYVQFIIERDPEGHFRFASLQSPQVQALLAQHQIPDTVDSVILIDSNISLLIFINLDRFRFILLNFT